MPTVVINGRTHTPASNTLKRMQQSAGTRPKTSVTSKSMGSTASPVKAPTLQMKASPKPNGTSTKVTTKAPAGHIVAPIPATRDEAMYARRGVDPRANSANLDLSKKPPTPATKSGIGKPPTKRVVTSVPVPVGPYESYQNSISEPLKTPVFDNPPKAGDFLKSALERKAAGMRSSLPTRKSGK